MLGGGKRIMYDSCSRNGNILHVTIRKAICDTNKFLLDFYTSCGNLTCYLHDYVFLHTYVSLNYLITSESLFRLELYNICLIFLIKLK